MIELRKQQNWYAKRLAAGVCVGCQRPHKGPRPRCDCCHQAELEKHRVRRNRLRENGCCVNCAMKKRQCVCKRKPYHTKHQWDDLTEQLALAVETALRDQRGLRAAIKQVLDFYEIATKKKVKAKS